MFIFFEENSTVLTYSMFLTSGFLVQLKSERSSVVMYAVHNRREHA